MYLAIIVLPILGSIVSGFFGRKVGVSGAQLITCICVIVTTILAIFGFFEVGLNNISVSILLFKWVDSESLNVLWGFNFDTLTVSMLIPVLIVSSLVHVYSIGYMSHDPHNQRFFSYLSLFTFMMIVLVTANNFLLMFVGWEGVGVCSYLLVSFWFTRIAANQSSMSAFLTNRVGDCFLTLGMFAMIWTFGNLDYSTVFSLAPYINGNVVTIIGVCLLIGAMAKSSQLGLHVWLPLAMEGEKIFFISIIFSYLYTTGLIPATYNLVPITTKRSLRTPSPDKPLIWVYDIINSSSLIAGSPFITKTDCANKLGINRATVRSYLDGDKLYHNKWLFSSTSLTEEELSKWVIPDSVWEIVTGEMLGDGYIKYDPFTPGTKGRLQFTFSSEILHYVKYLKHVALAPVCTEFEATPWPIPETTGKKATQYSISTKSLESISKLHSSWYKKEDGKNIKFVPCNIEELLTPLGLAHWIMGDGYFSENCTFICTDSFTKQDVERLIKVLGNKFGIKATLKKRKKEDGVEVWRIRTSRLSMEILKILVVPYLIPEMLYKVGIK